MRRQFSSGGKWKGIEPTADATPKDFHRSRENGGYFLQFSSITVKKNISLLDVT